MGARAPRHIRQPDSAGLGARGVARAHNGGRPIVEPGAPVARIESSCKRLASSSRVLVGALLVGQALSRAQAWRQLAPGPALRRLRRRRGATGRARAARCRLGAPFGGTGAPARAPRSTGGAPVRLCAVGAAANWRTPNAGDAGRRQIEAFNCVDLHKSRAPAAGAHNIMQGPAIWSRRSSLSKFRVLFSVIYVWLALTGQRARGPQKVGERASGRAGGQAGRRAFR